MKEDTTDEAIDEMLLMDDEIDDRLGKLPEVQHSALTASSGSPW